MSGVQYGWAFATDRRFGLGSEGFRVSACILVSALIA